MAGDRKTLIIICGQTATGKSALAIKIARHIDAEIISADSMQIYKGLEFLTFPPSKDEMQGVKHHFISFLEPTETFDVATFVKLAYEKAIEIWEKGKAVIIAGGTGLYIKSLMYGMFMEDSRDDAIRKELKGRFDKGEDLYSELVRIDPASAGKLHPNDRRRIIRALEVYYKTGMPISVLQKERKFALKDLAGFSRAIVLYLPKELLIERIRNRISFIGDRELDMLSAVLKKGISKTAEKVIGIRQLRGVLEGRLYLEEAKDEIAKETYRYARRQMIWFRNQPCGTFLTHFYDAGRFWEKQKNI